MNKHNYRNEDRRTMISEILNDKSFTNACCLEDEYITILRHLVKDDLDYDNYYRVIRYMHQLAEHMIDRGCVDWKKNYFDEAFERLCNTGGCMDRRMEFVNKSEYGIVKDKHGNEKLYGLLSAWGEYILYPDVNLAFKQKLSVEIVKLTLHILQSDEFNLQLWDISKIIDSWEGDEMDLEGIVWSLKEDVMDAVRKVRYNG